MVLLSKWKNWLFLGLISDVKDISGFTEVTNVNFRDSTFFNAIKNNDKAVDGF